MSIGSVSSRFLPPETDGRTGFSTLSSISCPFSIIDLPALQSSNFLDIRETTSGWVIKRESLRSHPKSRWVIVLR